MKRTLLLSTGLFVASCGGGPEITEKNSAPCGEHTIAVVHDERGATYAFCGHSDSGLLVGEVLPSGALESYLDREAGGVELFDRLMAGDTAPQWVREAIISGKHPGGEKAFIKEAKLDQSISKSSFALAGSCADPDAFFADSAIQFDSFYLEFANFGGWGGPYTPNDCVDEQEYNHEAWGTSQRVASWEWGNGACAANGRVLACGSQDTILTASIRGTPGSGAWSEFFNMWIPPGGFGKVKGYANGDHSCHPDQDRDDFWIRAESGPGGWHHYAATLVNRARNLNGTSTCDVDPE